MAPYQGGETGCSTAQRQLVSWPSDASTLKLPHPSPDSLDGHIDEIASPVKDVVEGDHNDDEVGAIHEDTKNVADDLCIVEGWNANARVENKKTDFTMMLGAALHRTHGIMLPFDSSEDACERNAAAAAKYARAIRKLQTAPHCP